MLIQHNFWALNAERQYQINIKNNQKTNEKLSSGYRINRAADDAASLTISEKMRRQLRGLTQGTLNAEDGMSYVNVADGAMDEISAMLQRMNELTVKSLNGTNTAADRTAMEAEFNELQSEIDRITKDTTFNTLKVFDQHEDTYYSIRGNRFWMPNQEHLLENGTNDLSVTIPDEAGGPDTTYTIHVPPGKYTTHELLDEIEDAFAAQVPEMPGFSLEYDLNGYCNFNYEGGRDVKSVTGTLSYLIYDNVTNGSLGSLLGTTQFIGDWPLRITPYNNELKFTLENIMGTSSTDISITVPSGNYTRKQMIDFLNSQLDKKGMTNVRASEYGERCLQLGGDEYFITGLKGNMFEIDDGKYSSIFYDNVKSGSISNSAGYFDSAAYLTLDTTDTEHNHFKIDSTNKQLKIRANAPDGTPYTTIELKEGSYTAIEMAKELNDAFKANGIDVTAQVKNAGNFQYLRLLSNQAGNGSKVEVDQASTCYNTLFQKTEYFERRNVTPVTGYYNTTEPYIKGSKNIAGLTITAPDNQLKLTVDGSSYTLTLTDQTYATADDIVAEINQQIANAGTGISGKITAKNSGGHLLITTTSSGSNINSIGIVDGSGSGKLYNDLFVGVNSVMDSFNDTANGTGSITFPEKLTEPIAISGNNTLNIIVNGIRKTVRVEDGTYTQAEIADIMNKQLKGASSTVTNNVNVSGKGSQNDVEGTTIPSDTAPASITLPTALPDVIEITADSNVLNINVNGNMESITLSAVSYTRQQFLDEINAKFRDNGIGVTASLSGGKLKFTTEKEGDDAAISLNTASGGSAMKVLAGTTTKKVPDVKVSFVDDKLTISGTQGGQTISAGTSTGGSMTSILVGRHNTTTGPDFDSRKVSKRVTSISGVSLSSPVAINSDNKKVHFQYSHDGTDYTVDFDLDEKDYSYAELQKALQDNISAQIGGTGRLAVSVSGSGVHIQAAAAGSQYKLSGFSGGFHTYVISGSRLIKRFGTPKRNDGRQTVDSPYIVGRQDVRNKAVTIKTGQNDTLKVDFTAPDINGISRETTLELTLDAGSYSGDFLAAQVQKQLDKELVKNGFAAGTIKASIGGISTGVIGSDDNNALNFMLPKDIGNMTAGRYVIDGVRGNAAYYIFYKTLGEPIPTYTLGTRDISGGVTIPADRNVFTFDSKGTTYEYTIPEGKYTAQEFLDLLNDKLANGDDNGAKAPIVAVMENNSLKLTATKMGQDMIQNVGGSARGQVFFDETGRDEEISRDLLIGDTADDMMELEILRLSSSSLKINTICISGEKYAKKALGRIGEALDILNGARTLYGAKYNRLTHAASGNSQTTENLTASESKLRDMDIAGGMMEHAKQTMLLQVSQSMMAQANQSASSVVSLLQI